MFDCLPEVKRMDELEGSSKRRTLKKQSPNAAAAKQSFGVFVQFVCVFVGTFVDQHSRNDHRTLDRFCSAMPFALYAPPAR